MKFLRASIMTAVTAAAAALVLSACGHAQVKLRPSNSCDSSPDGLKICRDQCNNNQARACYRIGWFYETGQEVGENMKTAIDHYKRACDLDFAVACRSLGQIYWDGDNVKRNPKVGLSFYRKACALGIPEACPTRAMVARSEGRRPQPGDDIAVEGAAGYAPDAPDRPKGPDAPTVDTPSAPTAETPSTPSLDVSTPGVN